ncbi:hypothetical protein J41TS8_37120 [Bacillus sp. J41TS8]|nr:hypothetical protein J41TS8_37120 [Bacillus sp. J41TS8]
MVKPRIITPKIIIKIPSHRTVLGFISPVAVGLFLVLSIIESISRSYKLLKAPAAPITKIDPINAKNISGNFSERLIL